MFLNTGLIIKAGSASGLIVIAHEIGHIKAGHIIKMKQTVENYMIIIYYWFIKYGLLIATTANDNFKDDRMKLLRRALSIGPSIASKSFFL